MQRRTRAYLFRNLFNNIWLMNMTVKDKVYFLFDKETNNLVSLLKIWEKSVPPADFNILELTDVLSFFTNKVCTAPSFLDTYFH